MPREETTTLTVHVSGAARGVVAANISDSGTHENVNEQRAFERLKAELIHAYAVPEAAYESLTAADIIQRNSD